MSMFVLSKCGLFHAAYVSVWLRNSPSWSLAGVVAVIVSGLLLLVQGEADFDATGFVLVMSASCMSGLRFTLTQLLLHGKAGHEHGEPLRSRLWHWHPLQLTQCSAVLRRRYNNSYCFYEPECLLVSLLENSSNLFSHTVGCADLASCRPYAVWRSVGDS